MDEKYDPKVIESKWQKEWDKADLFRVTDDNDKEKKKGFVAIPVTNEYWHDDFEVARNPRRFGLKNKLGNFPTWMDAIAVKENSSLHTWIEQQSASHGIRMSCP